MVEKYLFLRGHELKIFIDMVFSNLKRSVYSLIDLSSKQLGNDNLMSYSERYYFIKKNYIYYI